MISIVGLGNPGESYQNSRHNVGWRVLVYIQEHNGLPQPVASAKYAGNVSEGMLAGKEVMLLFPTTYMNASGSSVKKLVTTKEEYSRMIVVYDDVDLPIGEVKVSYGKGSGGHNGLQSIIDALGTKDFIRIRIGVASKGLFGRTKRPKGEHLSQHVLAAFTKREEIALKEVEKKVDDIIQTILNDGYERAMTEFN